MSIIRRRKVVSNSGWSSFNLLNLRFVRNAMGYFLSVVAVAEEKIWNANMVTEDVPLGGDISKRDRPVTLVGEYIVLI